MHYSCTNSSPLSLAQTKYIMFIKLLKSHPTFKTLPTVNSSNQIYTNYYAFNCA